MRRLVGYDLNGWRDLAARNWLEQPDEDDSVLAEHVVSGGTGGVIVRLGDAPYREIMGGTQALRAPHGLGSGWGAIGSADRRSRIADLLLDPAPHTRELGSALRAMADPATARWRGQMTAVLAIPDVSAYENEQEALLKTLRGIRASSDSLLVWRPVLACLAALEAGLLGEAERIGIVGHSGAGLTSQWLLMREDRGIKTPERRETGQVHDWEGGGLDALLQQARQALVNASRTPDRAEHLAAARSLVPLALGDAPQPEAVRLASGQWEIVDPAPPVPDLQAIPPALIARLADCDVVLLDTPASGTTRAALTRALGSALQAPLHALDHADVARGGLIAAGRIARGEPVYFDFLPQLSTIVQDETGARSFDLIPSDAVLPAGRVYRSKEPARLGLSPDTTTIKVYLRSQQSGACRLATVDLTTPPGRTATVTLDVEQVPAAGRARLTLSSDVFPAPRVVDWDRAETLSEDWDTLIENLQRPRPAIPNRVVLPCGLDLWQPPGGRAALEKVLVASAARNSYPWKDLAGRMSARSLGHYAVSSEGALPAGLSDAAIQALDMATAAAEAHVHARLDGTLAVNDNDSLRFLTWQFRRCPRSVIDPLMQALEAETGDHPFVYHHASRQLVYHALGRVIGDDPADADRIAAIFAHLLRVPFGGWNRDHLACAAFLLSRTECAPQMLEQQQIDRIARELVIKNQNAVGLDYTSAYLYTPIALLGLIRCRLRDPWCLVAGQNARADELLASTAGVIADMEQRFSGDARIDHYRAILEEVCNWIRGEGRNPDILLALTNLASGD